MRARLEVPAGWAQATVAEVASAPVVYGILQPGPDQPDGIPYVRPTEIQSGVIQVAGLRRTSRRIAEKYSRSSLAHCDVVMSIVGTIGKVAIVPPELDGANITQSSARIRLCRKIILPRFGAYALRSPLLLAQFNAARLGTAVPRLNLAHVRELALPVAPLAEQHRIVSAIESYITRLNDAVATLERAQRNLKRYRASVLKAAVEGQLVPSEAELARTKGRSYEPASVLLASILAARRRRWEDAELAKMTAKGRAPKDDRWKAKYVEPVAPDTSELPDLPEGWSWIRIDTAGHVQLGRQRSPAHHTGANMRPYLRVANVFEDRIDVSDVMSMHFTPKEFETYRLKSGDILLNEGQSPHLVGRPAMYRDEVPGACFTNSLVRFQAYEGVDPRFALLVFLAQLSMRRYMRIAQITTNIAHLGAGRFAEVEFPLPPLAEQSRIADEVDRLMITTHSATTTVATNLARVGRVRQSILKWAFEGRLVDQDPTDEPASVLLERFRAERASATNTQPRHARRPKAKAPKS